MVNYTQSHVILRGKTYKRTHLSDFMITIFQRDDYWPTWKLALYGFTALAIILFYAYIEGTYGVSAGV